MGTHLVACGQMHLRSPAGQDQLQMNLVMLKAQGKYSYIFTKMRYIAIGCGEVRHRVYFMQQLPLVSYGAEPTVSHMGGEYVAETLAGGSRAVMVWPGGPNIQQVSDCVQGCF